MNIMRTLIVHDDLAGDADTQTDLAVDRGCAQALPSLFEHKTANRPLLILGLVLLCHKRNLRVRIPQHGHWGSVAASATLS